MRRRKEMPKKTHIFLCVTILMLAVSFLSVGYSSLAANLDINDLMAIVRAEAVIRVTGITVEDTANEGTSNYEEYNKDNISGTIILPNSDSSVTYKIKVTNFGNVEMGIFDITGLPDDLEYETSGLSLKDDKICSEDRCVLDVSDYIYLTIKYKDGHYNSDSSHAYNLILDFDFRKFNNVTYLYNLDEKIIGLKKYEVMYGDELIVKFNNVDNVMVYENNTVMVDGYTYNDNTLVINEVIKDISIQEYKDINYVGTPVTYLGKDWYILSSNANEVTLLAKAGEFSNMASCKTSSSDNYCYWASRSDSEEIKWSNSYVVDYLNNTWLSEVDGSKLISSEVCDDTYSNGGSHLNDGTSCTNGYVTTKVRYISSEELASAKELTGSNTSWLYGDSVYVAMGNPYTFETNFVSTTGTVVPARTVHYGGNYNADHSVPIRPVITIPYTELKPLLIRTITYVGIDDLNLIHTAYYGESLTINFENNYQNIKVYVDDTLLTDGYTYSDGTLVISSVTGNLRIEAETIELPVGSLVQYLGKNWYVLSSDNTETKLLAKTGEFENMASCLTSSSTSYCYWVSRTDSVDIRWSKSYVVDYLNNTWLSTVDASKLIESEVCDDTYSNGGSHLNDGSSCTNGYISSKVRFITSSELNEAKAATSTNTTWLYGGSAYVAMGNPYTFETNFISTSGSYVAARTIDSYGNYNADHSVPIRPVIIVPTSELE